MFRLCKSRQALFTCLPTQPVKDSTGGIGCLITGERFTFYGSLLPPKRSVTRTVSGVRLALTWTLLPQGRPRCQEQDRLLLEGEGRVFLITAIKRYPRHLEYNLELL